MNALKLVWRAVYAIPSEIVMLAAFGLSLRTTLAHESLHYYSFITGFLGALAFTMAAERWARWTVKRVLRRAAKRPRTLVKGQPTVAGDPPEDPQTTIAVVMSKGAAYKLRKALIHADGKLNPDFRHPDDDPDASQAEWLMWAVGRIEVAEEVTTHEAAD